MNEKILEKIKKDKKELAATYGTHVGSIVYIGNNKYIVCLQDGKEIRI